MPRIALYSHDAQGLGHMRRNVTIARALAGDGANSILLIAGAREAARFALPAGVDTLALPALSKQADGAYNARSLGIDRDAILRLRGQILRTALREFAPDVLVVDKLPRGVNRELVASFEVLRALGTRVVLGMREVLDEPDRVHADWRRGGAYSALRRHYDAIWVYGDPQVYDPVTEYDIPDDIAALVSHSGYLGRGVPDALADGDPALWRRRLGLPSGPLHLCMVGGGEDGYRLADAFTRAELPTGTRGVVVTGPFMPAKQRRAIAAQVLERNDLHMLEFVPDADALVWLADRVIAMGGYNTTCEILSSGTHALVVPRVHPRREQLIRARRLSELGALDLLMPEKLSPAALSAWLAAPAAPRDEVAPAIDLGGVRRLPAMLQDVLAPGPALASIMAAPAVPYRRIGLGAAPG
jgi:predicted glycosyltransferase